MNMILSSAPIAAYSGGADAEHLELLVQNVHCAGCMSKIERAVSGLPGVVGARLNMSTHRLSVDFAPETLEPEIILQTVTALGYPATPYRAALAVDAGAAEERALLLALAVAGFAAGNVMLLSVSVWAGALDDMGAATRGLFHWLSALIALPAVAFAGRPFFRSAWSVLRSGSMNMDVPISLAVILASGVSLAETISGGPHAYFDAAVTLLFFLLIGRYLDHRARARARSAAASLLSMSGETARLIDPDGHERVVPLGDVAPEMMVTLSPGEKIPVDGIVATGVSDIDSSLLTGEAVPETIRPGGAVYAGTLNLTGPLSIRVKAAVGDTLLADIVRLMETAERGRSAYVVLVDRIARFYSPAVHALAFGTFVLWWMLGAGVHDGLLNAVAVLIITCPCALGLAVPVVRVVAHGLLFTRGVLVKAPDALERLAQIDTVIFDKTGTLTRGELEPVERPSDGILAEAAALAGASRHPLSRAVADAGAHLPKPCAVNVVEVAGSGVEGTIGGEVVRLGRRAWAAPGALETPFDGPELWYSASGGTYHRFRFRDSLKEDAVETVAALQALGIHVAILSGDHTASVAAVANKLGIADWQAGCRPNEKVDAVNEFALAGHRVLMVGDGLNDAPALAAGFVSASPASGADISRTAADIVFQGKFLAPVVWMVRVGQGAQARVRENIALSIA